MTKRDKDINRDFDYFKNREDNISIFIGAYGSGKSEVSVNTAMLLAEMNRIANTDDLDDEVKQNTSDQGQKISMESDIQANDISKKSSNDTNRKTTKEIILADLDVVNPFFRSLDAKKLLNEHGVRVISSLFANTNSEVASVPHEVMAVFDNRDIHAILDIGGDDLGARIVSSLKSRIVASPYSIYMVINTNRPFTGTKDKIIKTIEDLTSASGFQITALINNTNLLEDTAVEDLLESNILIKEVSEITGIPFAFCAGMDDLYPESWGNVAPDGVGFMRLERSIYYG
jgi:hypothetical protein